MRGEPTPPPEEAQVEIQIEENKVSEPIITAGETIHFCQQCLDRPVGFFSDLKQQYIFEKLKLGE